MKLSMWVYGIVMVALLVGLLAIEYNDAAEAQRAADVGTVLIVWAAMLVMSWLVIGYRALLSRVFDKAFEKLDALFKHIRKK